MYLSVNYKVTFIYCQSVMCQEINELSALQEKTRSSVSLNLRVMLTHAI